jgi:hypothetical protein
MLVLLRERIVNHSTLTQRLETLIESPCFNFTSRYSVRVLAPINIRADDIIYNFNNSMTLLKFRRINIKNLVEEM